MKKDKIQDQDRSQDPVNTDQKEVGSDSKHNHNGKNNSSNTTDSPTGSVNATKDQDKQSSEKTNESPVSVIAEKDTSMMEAEPIRESNGTSTKVIEGISQEDLDGGLLDGALDDYDDLDQDTEDTEVGDGEVGFSDDDDDDEDDDDLDGKAGQDDMHSPDGMSLDETSKLNDRDMDTADESVDHQDKDTAMVHSEDSDSDLPDPEGSDNEHEDDDEEEEEGEEEEGEEEDGEDDDLDDEDEDEVPVKKAAEPKKDNILSQKPVLNRPSVPEEELKDSGDDLSDLSEFDDTDDSDEDDDDVPEAKTLSKESNTNPSSAPATTPVNGKPLPAGRKRSLHDAGKDAFKQVQESVKTEQDDQAEVPNGRARLLERKAPEVENEHHTDKESSSEVPEEEEEEKAAEEEEDEEEDMETKQLHKDALEALTSIEVEFAHLRDKMYEERMTELDREVEMINAGTHPELSSLMQEIEQKREQRLHFSDMGRKYLIDIANNTYNVAEYRAHCTFQSAKRTARSDLLRQLGKKQRQMMMELTLTSETNKRKVIEDKATLLRARKLKRMEASELKIIVNEQRCFPGSTKLRPITNVELNSDFTAMGLARLLPQAKHGEQVMAPSRGMGQLPPSMPIPSSAISSRKASTGRWGGGMDYPPPHTISQPGGYYGPRPEVEIYVEGERCMIDGIWYKPNDHVVVLDAAIGKYNAKYLFFANDEIMLQRTDGSKTRLHLGQFRGRKLCMQPKS
ncbi:hypothetical protein BGZ46_007874 [Entomortierella lignicola]|nr:hypothetical protein BGZ46_007874 [Entomortierella lignicola]